MIRIEARRGATVHVQGYLALGLFAILLTIPSLPSRIALNRESSGFVIFALILIFGCEGLPRLRIRTLTLVVAIVALSMSAYAMMRRAEFYRREAVKWHRNASYTLGDWSRAETRWKALDGDAASKSVQEAAKAMEGDLLAARLSRETPSASDFSLRFVPLVPPERISTLRSLGPGILSYYSRLFQYRSFLHEKYAHAARYPWLPIKLDPPPPVYSY